jgi:hypothetical protein
MLQELTPLGKVSHYVFADASHNPSVSLGVSFLAMPTLVDCMGDFMG